MQFQIKSGKIERIYSENHTETFEFLLVLVSMLFDECIYNFSFHIN